MEEKEAKEDLNFRMLNGDLITISYENYEPFCFNSTYVLESSYVRIQKYIAECLEDKPKNYRSVVIIDPEGNKVEGTDIHYKWDPNVLYSVYIDKMMDDNANILRILGLFDK